MAAKVLEDSCGGLVSCVPTHRCRYKRRRLLCDSFELPVRLPCFCFSGRLSQRTRNTNSRTKKKAGNSSSTHNNLSNNGLNSSRNEANRPGNRSKNGPNSLNRSSRHSLSNSGLNGNRSGLNKPSHNLNSSSARSSLSNSSLSNSSRNEPNRPSSSNDPSNHSVHSSRQSRGNSSGDGNSRARGRDIVRFSRIVLNTGTAIIAPGRSAEDMVVTTFLRIVLVSISEVSTGFGCPAQRSTWGILVLRTVGFPSCSWIPGRNIGQEIGTRPMRSEEHTSEL